MNSGRAHIYLSDKPYGEEGFRSGLRGKCPIEIKVALLQAVLSGIIISRTNLDGLITAERIPSAFLISVDDTENDQLLWNRADSNTEPSEYDPSAAASAAARVTLTARDDRDLGDLGEENDAGSGRPDASAGDSASAARKRDQAEVTQSADEETASQPASHRRGCAELSFQQTPSPSQDTAQYVWLNAYLGSRCVRLAAMSHYLSMRAAE